MLSQKGRIEDWNTDQFPVHSGSIAIAKFADEVMTYLSAIVVS
jgi:hypothetical protein